MTKKHKARSLVYSPLRWHVARDGLSKEEIAQEEALEKIDDYITSWKECKEHKLLSDLACDISIEYWIGVRKIVEVINIEP